MEYSDAVMSNVEMRVPTGDTLEEEQWIGEWLNQEMCIRDRYVVERILR